MSAAAKHDLLHKTPETARISVLTSGALLLNGLPSDMDAIKVELQRVKAANGEVWYYREGPQAIDLAEPVLDLITDCDLPVMLSTRADFSDYVDDHGQSRLRGLITPIDTASWLMSVSARWSFLAVVVGCIVAAFQVPPCLEARSMLATGVKTDALITEKNQWTRHSPRGGDLKDYTYAYEFSDPLGAKFVNAASYDPSVTQIQEGDTVKVVYNAATPSVSQPLAQYEHDASISNVALDVFDAMGAVLLFGGVMTFLYWLKLKKHKMVPIVGVWMPHK